jgi:hypothetical protein
VSGEKKWNKTRYTLTAVSTLRVWPRSFSVLSLIVASTTGRSRIRKDHIRTLLTLSHQSGDDDDGIEREKGFQRTIRSTALVSRRPGRRRAHQKNTERRRRMEKD